MKGRRRSLTQDLRRRSPLVRIRLRFGQKRKPNSRRVFGHLRLHAKLPDRRCFHIKPILGPMSSNTTVMTITHTILMTRPGLNISEKR